ncbi:MAG: response regulator [candidate division NC10 bacterium]|nr:response regulator [candidate division NC10 bacterium]
MNSPKILVVDDNPPDLAFVAAALSDAKYSLVTELDSRTALRRFVDEGPWHLLISDLKMPGMDGLTLLTRIKACDPLAEAIIITGHADTSSAIEALRLGAFSYLVKPVHPQELQHCVGRALDRRRLTTEQHRLIKELEARDARRGREIATIASMGNALNSLRRPTELDDEVLPKIATALGADGLAFFLFEEARNELLLTAQYGLPQPVVDQVKRRQIPAAGRSRGCSLRSGEPVLIEKDASLDPRLCAQALQASGVNSLLSVPFRSQGEIIGCIEAYTLSRDSRGFTSEDREFLEAVSHLVGNAIQARKQEQQTRDAEKLAAVGELAAGVAHELGNVFAIVGGAVQYLLANTDTASPSRQYLEAIHRNVAAGDRIIKGLLSFARPSSPRLEPTDIHEILEQARLSLEGEMAKARVTVSRHYWPEPLQVFADAQQMQQVFLNILLNAVQAMPRGGTVTLRAFPEPPLLPWAGVRVEVADTGTGIPAEYLHRVFEPFFTTKEGGTGLGLAVSRQIVAAHGGELGVESQKGRGTRFTIRLPMSPSASPSRADASRGAGGAATCNSAAPPDHRRVA